MSVRTNLSRWDLVLANIEIQSHTNQNSKLFLIYWIGTTILYLLRGYRPGSAEQLVRFIITTGVIAVALFIVITLLIVVTSLFNTKDWQARTS